MHALYITRTFFYHRDIFNRIHNAQDELRGHVNAARRRVVIKHDGDADAAADGLIMTKNFICAQLPVRGGQNHHDICAFRFCKTRALHRLSCSQIGNADDCGNAPGNFFDAELTDLSY